MNPLRSFAAFLRRSRLDRGMDEEVCAHIEERRRRNVASGTSLDEAVSAARRQLG